MYVQIVTMKIMPSNCLTHPWLEDSIFLGYDLYHWVIRSRRFEGSQFLLNAGHFETSETDYPVMRPHIPEARGVWLHRDENIKACITNFFHSKILPELLSVFWQRVSSSVVVIGEEANDSLGCNNVLVGQAYSKPQEWLQTATERWKNSDCQRGKQVPRQNLTQRASFTAVAKKHGIMRMLYNWYIKRIFLFLGVYFSIL